MYNQQKGVEDYRNAVQLLKNNVIKLQKLNVDLNDKLRDDQNLAFLNLEKKPQEEMTNQNAMLAYSRSCKRMEFSPEMLFRALDFDGTGSIKVQDFRIFISKSRLGISQAAQNQIVEIINGKPSGIINKDDYVVCLQTFGIDEEKVGGALQQTEKVEERRDFKLDMQGLLAINSKLQSQGINVLNFIQEIMDKLIYPAAGVMLHDVCQAFINSGKNVSKQDQLKFFQILDSGDNGSIDFDELMIYYLLAKKDTDSFDGLFKILARKLQANQIDISQYLGIETVYEDTELNMDSFFRIAKILFCVPDRKVSDALFKYMDSDRSGILQAVEIIHAVQNIVEKYCPTEVLIVKQNLQESLMKLDEYDIIINKMKRVLVPDDFFDVRTMRGQKLVKKKWKTIFNSDVACLKFCYDLVKELEQTPGKKWSDPEFGSTPTDQYGSKSMYFADNDIAKGCPHPQEVQWLRPEEVIATMINNGYDEYHGKSVEMFAEGNAGANDVVQSQFLGNCWFISALSIIARYDKYLQGEFVITGEAVKNLQDNDMAGMQSGVCPPCFQFLVKYGIYVMRFFKNFGWRYVVIDDRLAFKDGEFVYGKCRSATTNWVNLIEKAYAKLHNCYDALSSGDIAQGLADMTGLAADKLKLKGENMTIEEKESLWTNLVESKKNGSMMGCSAEGGTEFTILISGEDTGIMSGHAYGVIDVFEIEDQECKNYHKSHRLLLLRNPWGHGEWKLKWSEEKEHSQRLDKYLVKIDAYYDEEIKNAIRAGVEPPEKYKSGVDDGLFLICYKDWRRLFCNLFQCIKFPEEWSGRYCRDRFGLQTAGVPKNTEDSKIAYAMKNPQYIIDINRQDGKDTVVYIQMKQLDGRLFQGEKYPFNNVMRYILLCVFKLENGEAQLSKFDKKKMVVSSEKVNLKREIDTDRIKLPNGRYAIIPCTQEPGEQADYSINVYYDCKHQEIKFAKYGDTMLKFDLIAAEEEIQEKISEEMKVLLKKQALDVIAHKAKAK